MYFFFFLNLLFIILVPKSIAEWSVEITGKNEKLLELSFVGSNVEGLSSSGDEMNIVDKFKMSSSDEMEDDKKQVDHKMSSSDDQIKTVASALSNIINEHGDLTNTEELSLGFGNMSSSDENKSIISQQTLSYNPPIGNKIVDPIQDQFYSQNYQRAESLIVPQPVVQLNTKCLSKMSSSEEDAIEIIPRVNSSTLYQRIDENAPLTELCYTFKNVSVQNHFEEKYKEARVIGEIFDNSRHLMCVQQQSGNNVITTSKLKRGDRILFYCKLSN